LERLDRSARRRTQWPFGSRQERGKSFPDGQEKSQVFAVIMKNQEGVLRQNSLTFSFNNLENGM